MPLLNGICIILVCQLTGEFVVQLLDAPVPGPVVGFLLLFAGLLIRGEVPSSVRTVADTLLGYLALLFVPAGVGLVVHFGLIRDAWIAITAALVISTGLALIVTLIALQGLLRTRTSPQRDES